MRYCFIPNRMMPIEKTPRCENMQHIELLYTAGADVRWDNHVGKEFAISYKVKFVAVI